MVAQNPMFSRFTPIPHLQAGAEPFYFRGGRIGALCVHGLTASPQEVYWLGKSLADRGFTVFGPRLDAHGSNFEELHRARWQRWYYDLLDGYALLQQSCDRIVVLGMSMGGLLSLHLAAEKPVAGVVLMATPLYLNSPLWLAYLLRYIRPQVSQYDRATDPLNQRITELQRERGEIVTGRIAYYRHSAGGLAEMHKLQGIVASDLAKINAPVLAIYSEGDTTVPIGNIDRLRNGLISVPRLEVLRLHKSGHIVTCDIECDSVFDAAGKFLKDIE